MKKQATIIMLVVTIMTVVGLAGCSHALVAPTAPSEAASKPAISSEELASAINGKKIYLYNGEHGVAVSDVQAKNLAVQAGDSMFEKMLSGGYESTDSKTGITFVTDDDNCKLNDARIWIVDDGTSLSALMSVTDADPVRVSGEIQTDFGIMRLCLLDL